MNKCIGCGVIKQNNSKDEIGYTKNIDNLYCERCFKTTHYGEKKEVNVINTSSLIDKINELNLFTFFITDLINLNESIINNFKSINNKKVLIINKCDIIPNNLKLEHIEQNIKDSYNINSEVFFISAKKGLYLNRLINLIESNKKVIFCGETSSGKSTLINYLTDSNLTTSKYNNTTLDFIKIKYLDYVIYDTPGIVTNNEEIILDNISLKLKQSKKEYVLNIKDYKLQCESNLSFIINSKFDILSKKEDVSLNNSYIIENNSDIVIPKVGFIYIKNKTEVKTNKKIEIRKSIIGR